MKVAHRIIALLVIPREKRSTIRALELKILYVMAHPDESLIPHYRSFLCNKLIHLSTSRLGKHYCGGIVSMFEKSAPVRAPYPENNQPLPTIIGPWAKNHNPKLLITPENKNIISLNHPTNFTNHQITPYLLPTSYSSDRDEEDEESEEDGGDDGGEEEPQNIPPTGGASSSRGATKSSYHQQYMD
ncbi:unnamed protein product [Lactuca saligna]|uniref:Uncharacterized protein n=1 Tax=Lactuca saligna TaxID=75948 RepID=A0AA35Z5Q3_LACSI|nr:unnamed protein product [Lactuca saligna]